MVTPGSSWGQARQPARIRQLVPAGDAVPGAPDPRVGGPAAGASLGRSLITQAGLLGSDPPPETGSAGGTAEQDRCGRTLRLDVRANASEPARDPGAGRFTVRSLKTAERKRAFAVVFTRSVPRWRGGIPRTAKARIQADTSGQPTLTGLLAAYGGAMT